MPVANASNFDDVAHPVGADSATHVTSASGASTQTPFYRKRSFLRCQVVSALVGIGLLFVLLYPVVRAISQHVVDASTLNIDKVTIAQPSNTS